MKRDVFGLRIAPLLAGLVAVLVAIGVLPVLSDWKERQFSELSDAQMEIASLERRATRLHDELALIQDNQTDALKWSAEGQGVATARIQAQVNEFAAKHGLALRSMSPTGTGDLSEVETVSFRLEAEATLDRFVSFLRDVEYGQPVILVDEANLRRINRPGSASEFPTVFVQLSLIAPVAYTSEVPQ